jgi:hypothetical protein
MKTMSIHAHRLPIATPSAKLIHPDNPINYRKSQVLSLRSGVTSTMTKPFLKVFSGDTP